MKLFIAAAATVAILAGVPTAQAGAKTSSDFLSINSDVTGLNGAGIIIGQVEQGHPGRSPVDFLAVPHVRPTFVSEGGSPASALVRGFLPPGSEAKEDAIHAGWVAEIMIGDDSQGDQYKGVAPGAALYASYIPTGDLSDEVTLAAMARRTSFESGSSERVRSINMSYGLPLQPFIEQTDGNSHLTKFVDWSSRVDDVLYVSAWPNGTNVPSSPVDNYNGMVVGPAFAVSNFEVRLEPTTAADPRTGGYDALGDRTSISLVAPGYDISLFDPETFGPVTPLSRGSSFAAPHVTGAVALLQQYAIAHDFRTAAGAG